MALITCQNVSFAYEGLTVISGLNFEVNSGDYLCITGENGSGKSTLLKGLLRLKQPKNGNIFFNGIKPYQIGYLPQQTAVQKDFPTSAYEVVLSGRLGGSLRPFYTKEDRAVAAGNMERLGLNGAFKNKCYRELSGGQQQRVLLARALCSASKLLLLDEPAAGLDPIVVRDFYYEIDKINKELSITIIMVSHDIQNAVGRASHILHLGEGKQLFCEARKYKETETGKKFLR